MLGAELTCDSYLDRLKTEIDRVDQGGLQRWADLLYAAWEEGRFVYLIGNGGSGTTATHMCEDLGKSTPALRQSAPASAVTFGRLS